MSQDQRHAPLLLSLHSWMMTTSRHLLRQCTTLQAMQQSHHPGCHHCCILPRLGMQNQQSTRGVSNGHQWTAHDPPHLHRDSRLRLTHWQTRGPRVRTSTRSCSPRISQRDRHLRRIRRRVLSSLLSRLHHSRHPHLRHHHRRLVRESHRSSVRAAGQQSTTSTSALSSHRSPLSSEWNGSRLDTSV